MLVPETWSLPRACLLTWRINTRAVNKVKISALIRMSVDVKAQSIVHGIGNSRYRTLILHRVTCDANKNFEQDAVQIINDSPYCRASCVLYSEGEHGQPTGTVTHAISKL